MLITVRIFFNGLFNYLLSPKSSQHVWHAFNALFIIRCLVKYVIETGSEYQLLQNFEAVPSTSAETQTAEEQAGVVATYQVDGSKFERFFDAVVQLIVVIPVK